MGEVPENERLRLWQGLFSDILGDEGPSEIDAAATAACRAEDSGLDYAEALAAGKHAARGAHLLGTQDHVPQHPPETRPIAAPVAARQQPSSYPSGPLPRERLAERPVDSSAWSLDLARRIFDPPPRWGWQAAVHETLPEMSSPPPKPVAWTEAPRPDTRVLHKARRKAVSSLIRRLTLAVLVVAAMLVFKDTATEQLRQAPTQVQRYVAIAILVFGLVLFIGVLRAAWAIRRTARDLHAFEGPYLQLRREEKARHDQALREWERAVQEHDARARDFLAAENLRHNGPLWFPVAPQNDPLRIDVFGGDPRRNGWASLLVTIGTSVISSGRNVTVVDFTGQDVAGNLAAVADASHRSTRALVLDTNGHDVNLLAAIPTEAIPGCLAQAVNGAAAEQRHERAMMSEVLATAVSVLDGRVTFARLAAAVHVLRQGGASEILTPREISALTNHVGDLDQNEWMARQLRFLVSQLQVLGSTAPGGDDSERLWSGDDVLRIVTSGARDDRQELLARLLLQIAQRGLEQGQLDHSLLVVAGADHLGTPALRAISEQARLAGTPLVLMLDQLQGDLETSAGTGGAVCIMKLYNHRDAAIAAEFVGRGHKFVMNQVTRQVGKTFTDGGGDSFSANTGASSSPRPLVRPNLSTMRGHAWTGVRNWSASDNSSLSTSASRVYEFVVEPAEMLEMPETAFLLVDSSGSQRRVVLADGNPAICLLDRVSSTPLGT